MHACQIMPPFFLFISLLQNPADRRDFVDDLVFLILHFNAVAMRTALPYFKFFLRCAWMFIQLRSISYDTYYTSSLCSKQQRSASYLTSVDEYLG